MDTHNLTKKQKLEIKNKKILDDSVTYNNRIDVIKKHGIESWRVLDSKEGKEYVALRKSDNEIALEKVVVSQIKDNNKVLFDGLLRLQRVINECIPLNTEILSDRIKNGIAAIAERNKMLGLYAPQKTVSMNLDSDDCKIIQKYKEMLELNKKDF